MNLSGNRNDNTRALSTTPSIPTTSMGLSTSNDPPVSYGSEVDPIFTAWDKHTGITIHPSQIVADAADIVPTGLAASSQGLTAGTQSAYVVLTWNAIVSASFSHYKVRYKRNAFSAYSYVDVYTNTVSIEGLVSNTLYNFGVASVNKSDVLSAYSASVDVTTTADTTAPATVIGVSASAGIQTAVLKWTANTDADIASYNIYRYTANTVGNATLIGNVAANYFVDAGLPDNQIQYYWLKAKDTSGNLSAAYSTVVSVTPRDVLGIDVLAGLITANLLDVAAINPIDGEINANKIGTLQLDDDAVTAAKVLDGELTAAKLNVAAINPVTGYLNANTVGTAQIDIGAVTHALLANNAIEANNLATASVTGPAIQSSAITAAKIGAGEVTATHILTGALDATHITSFNFIVTEGTFTSNSPTDSISWTGCKVMYDGVEHAITNGSCGVGDKHIYWELASPTSFLHTVSLPALTDDGFLVAFNDNGTYRLVWNSTVVNGNRITTGSVTASNIAAGTITSNEIKAGTITAANIAAGAITADLITSYNFQLITPDTFVADTPSTNQISWIECEVVYGGVKYTVAAGECSAADIYVYWELSAPTVFSHTETLPNLSQDGFIVATNGNTYYGKGTPVYVWNATTIDGNRITAGSIVASMIAAGTITADRIGVGEITATQIAAGTITATEIAAQAIEASHLSVTAGATFVSATGGKYNSALTGARVNLFPDANTGLQALNASGSNVFKIEVGGTNSGDVTIGNYSGGQGILYDNSANTTYFEGNITATEGLIGAWTIDEDSMYTGTKVESDGFAADVGDITIRSTVTGGSIHAKNFYIDEDGEVSFSAQSSTANINGVGFKKIDIGYWNMDSTDHVDIDPLTVPSDILGINVIIISDSTDGYKKYPIHYTDDSLVSGIPAGNWSIVDGTNIRLSRWGGGHFDSSAFDAAAENRGYIIIQYSI
jgi:hypothetical protein